MRHTSTYDTIGNNYNDTRRADPYLAEKLYQLLEPRKNGLFLDIGCGTGNYTAALAEKGLNFIGVEPSELMLGRARNHNTNVSWLKGLAEQIPAEEATFDGVIATLTLHHWKDLQKGFGEISRVMKKQAQLVIFTSTPEQMQGYWLNHYFPRMLQASIHQMPSLEQITKACKNAGLSNILKEPYFIQDGLKDHFLYVGKNRPQLYFDEPIRNGISSFSSLANLEEVKLGLAQLRDDLKSGKWEEVRKNFENNRGDYLFLKVEKA